MKSIAIIVPELLPVPPVQGGAVEHWVDEASRRMILPGRRLAVISRPSGISGTAGVEYIDIPWTPLERFFHSLKEKMTWKNPLRYLAKIQNVCSYGIRAARAVRDFDMVYLHNEPNLLLFMKPQAGRKIVLHMHNDHLAARLFRGIYRRVLARADKVICVSDYIRRQAVACFPEHASRFCVVINSTDPATFRPYGKEESCAQLASILNIEADKRYLLYVGRLVHVKGVHVLIAAFREIHRRLPDTRLIIAGSSFFGGAARTAYEASLEKLAETVSEAIVFTGYLPHEKLRYLYSAADAVVFPSIWQEPCGLVILEAMAAGTCLVASCVGGAPEIVENDRTGVLVTPDDPDALAEAVCNTLAQPERMRRLESAGRQLVLERFTWERLVHEVEGILKS